VYIYDTISLNSSLNENYLDNVVEKIKTHFMFSNIFSKVVPFMR